MDQRMKQWYIDSLGWEWFAGLRQFIESSKMNNIRQAILEARRTANVYPSADNVFRAFKLCPLNEVKVVIIGQDPYHTPGVADGLAFSTKSSVTPPSLRNIFTELKDDVGVDRFIQKENSLEDWASQGILLLNTAFTTVEGMPGIHSKLWEPFTKEVIKVLNKQPGIIYVLWGRHAQSYKNFIDLRQNFLLEAAHPSPFSANNGFFGCKHFSEINKLFTVRHGEGYKINW